MNLNIYNMVNEGIDEYVDGINTIDDFKEKLKEQGTFIFSRTNSKNIENIKKTGTSREFIGTNGAHAYGFGLYSTLTLKGELSSSMKVSYGDALMKLWVPGFERCIIGSRCISDSYPGQYLANVVHGGKSVNEQIDMFVHDKRDAEYLKSQCDDGEFPSDDSRVEQIIGHYNIDGICFGRGDGSWCVWKDYKRVIPYIYTLDDGRNWKEITTQKTIDVTVNTFEPNVVFGKNFKNIVQAYDMREYNGYFLVQWKKTLKWNYIDAKTKNTVSNIDFDLATPVNEDGFAKVRYNGMKFVYDINSDALYDADDPELDFNMEMGEYTCTTEELKNNPSILGESKSFSLFGNKLLDIINENIDEYVDSVKREDVTFGNKDLYYFYRMAHKQQTESIATNGFSKEFRGTGKDNTDWLGSGTYGILYPRTDTSGSYGEICWCYAIPKHIVQNHYITPNPKFAQKYGINGTYEEQLKRFFPDLWPKWEKMGLINAIVTPGYSDSDTIANLLKICFRGRHGESDGYLHAHNVQGFLYHGNNDGDCILSLDDTTVIPISYRDNSKRGDTWHSIEINDTLWNRTYNNYDPLALLKDKYYQYGEHDRQWIINNYRVENGYMLVKNKKTNKFNYINAKETYLNNTDNIHFASNVDFDRASSVRPDGTANVFLNGQKYVYVLPDDALYDADDPELEFNMEMGEYTYKTEELI